MEEKEKMIGKLNGKKGLLAVALLIGVILAGALAPGYYTWKFTYKINPLTENEEITLPKTTGATIDWTYILPPELGFDKIITVEDFVSAVEEKKLIGFPGTEFVEVREKRIFVDKPIDVYFMVTKDDADALAEHYWQLYAFILIFEHNDENGNGVAGEFVSMVQLDIVVNQNPELRVLEGSENLANSGAYDVAIVIYSWTGAVESEVSGTFTIYVWAVEKPLA
jgi:hypothetical protein